ncbi:MAG: hypothetical protein EXR77_01385 [Myxococcales bacterium]|nr:hypothetical protein [Myxococcales bacterium]
MQQASQFSDTAHRPAGKADPCNPFRSSAHRGWRAELRHMGGLVMRAAALTTAVWTIGGVAGCTTDVKQIDRTQVNRVAKGDLRGVWYEIDMITDIPPTAAFGFAGQTNFGGEDSGKVMFDVQENNLVVYPVTEKVIGSDAKWSKRKIRKYWDATVTDRADKVVKDSDFIEIYVANPVAMYPIVSHFDVIRDYSASTGEQTNVLVENTVDRPWWQRKYLRVDWSGNSILNYMFRQTSVKYSALDYFVPAEDMDNPSKFYMTGAKDYFHFTRRLYGQPMSTGACSPYSLAPGDCSGAVVEVRIAFRRLDIKRTNDYEVRRYSNNEDQDRFGYFLAERYRYDENYGLINSGKDSKAGRWNLWQKSKTFSPVLDKAGKAIGCLTNRDCTAPAICDQTDWFEPGSCKTGARIDYSQRGVRPIVYHTSVDHPINHLPAVYGTADGWSDVFNETISWLLFWEEKWATDGVKGFPSAQSSFGQRLCQTNSDCGNVAASSIEFSTKAERANYVVVPVSKSDAVVVSDCTLVTVGDEVKCGDRKATGDNGAMVALVNASPGTTLSLKQLPGGDIANVPYVNSLGGGKVAVTKAIVSGRVLDKAQLGTVNLKVSGGSKDIDIPNVKIGPTDVLFVVVVGGDAAVVLRSKGVANVGIRAVNGFKSGTEGDLSTGATYEVGINGVRMSAGLPYAQGTEFLFQAGDMAHVTLVVPGHRADVSCGTHAGVSQCYGWQQKLNASDVARRKAIKDSLPAAFVVCENKFARTFAQCKASKELGSKDAMNDCRNWVADGKTYGKPGKAYNPCADRKDGGEVAEAAKLKIHGDARYNYMYWVTKVHAASPLGYGPSAQDPDTGETFFAIANVYGASQLTYSQYAKDVIDLINGDLDGKDLASGKYIKDYVLRKSAEGKNKTLFGAISDKLPELSAQQSLEFAAERASFSLTDRAAAAAATSGGEAKELTPREIAQQTSPKALNKWLVDNLPAVDLDALQMRAEKIKGSAYEAAMINDEMVLVGSQGQSQPGQAVNPEMIESISPLGFASPRGAMDEKRRMQFLGINSIELAEFQDPAILGLAQRMKCDDGETPTEVYVGDGIGKNICYKGDALRTAISVALYKATMEHEVGHTVGLRHNFSASTDLVNYFDPYFDEQKGGRTRELVACGTIIWNGVTVTADSFCEAGTLGESCDLKHACESDDDCPTNTACADKAKQCVDANAKVVGVCQQHIEVRTPCTAATADICGGAGACVGDICHDKVTCTKAEECEAGELCTASFCINARNKLPRTSVQFTPKVGDARKYMSRTGLTAAESKGRRTEYQYSSVMDYGQKINADVWGLGKYDYAAIKYGYGELTEVYEDTEFLTDRVRAWAKNTGYSIADASGFGATEYNKYQMQQFSFINDWMPPEYNVKRIAVPDRFVQAERSMADNFFRSEMDRTFHEVPYKYCSDEYRGGSMGCYYFDTGHNMEEIVHHAAEALEEYYIFDAFKRERLWFGRGGSYLSYMARIRDRWLTPIISAGRYYAIYNNIYRVYPGFAYRDTSERFFAPLRRACENSFRVLTNMLATPAPGSYVLDKKSNTYTNIDYETGRQNSVLDIPLGTGKFPYTTFATQKGYYQFDHPLWIGAYWDKVAALQALTNSTTGFLSEYVGEQLPVFRATAIGYNTIYPNELMRVLGGLIAGDIQQFAGTAAPDPTTKKLAYRTVDPFKPVDTTATRVAPSVINHGLRLFAAWQSIANLPAGFDPSYTDAMAVWIKGHGEQFTLGKAKVDNKEVVIATCEFEDPFGKKTYVAPRPNYSVSRYSPAFTVCKKLNMLKTGCADGSQCQPCNAGDSGCATGTCTDSSSCRGDTWWTKAQGADKEMMSQQMKQEIEILDRLRELYALYGSIGSGN